MTPSKRVGKPFFLCQAWGALQIGFDILSFAAIAKRALIPLAPRRVVLWSRDFSRDRSCG
jgi:hypothetical protein